ncbi:peroxiredoxin [Limimaricola soesokkakensis]|uniref:AhpC/TSA family protein n=1 Tax=Limimaricola soesokkakensis TaxID=1343159 RepID=A0A1X7A542_9RHOB|nr:peroxiredoxin-like family protein [Limimaricola soesokkakensis]PSK81009.1 peroxiredoxin [Limimaricola soesokkakensis]SLN68839.1 AhpC/TSA family protein [Limimaricola soesokkakensis]
MAGKPTPDAVLPEITLPRLGGGEITLGKPLEGRDWQMVVVYRGKHCPICHKYVSGLEPLLSKYHEAGIDVVLVSGDPEEKARAFVDETGTSAPVAYDLSVPQMLELGLYVSDPRSPQETDRPFAEPAVFVINDKGTVHIADISNAPFSRPDLEGLLSGLKFIRDNDYPIRGTKMAA